MQQFIKICQLPLRAAIGEEMELQFHLIPDSSR